MRLVYIFRKTGPFFSIENIFHLLASRISRLYGRNVEEVRLPREGLRPGSIWANRSFARRLRADIFHVTGDVHYITLFLPGRKTILTIHDCVFMHQHTGIKRNILRYWLLKRPVARCEWITTVSENTKEDILRYCGGTGYKIVVIPNPVNGNFTFKPASFNAEQPVLLFIGTTPNKNLDRVMDAITGLPCLLDIVGQLPEKTMTRLREMNIEFRLSFSLSDAEVVEKYEKADIVLFPSTFEGFGMPIVEGQRTGRPVITSDLSPMKEVAGDGACLVDPYSTESIRTGLLKVVGDAAYRDTLIRKGLENSKRFDPDSVAALYEDLYKKIMRKTTCAE